MAVGSGREGTTEDYGKEGLEYIKNDYRVWKRGLTGNFHQLKIYTLWHPCTKVLLVMPTGR